MNYDILKFSLPSAGHGNLIQVQLENASTIPLKSSNLSPKTTTEEDTWSDHTWPLDITAGDISRDGKILLLRSYNGEYFICSLEIKILQIYNIKTGKMLLRI